MMSSTQESLPTEEMWNVSLTHTGACVCAHIACMLTSTHTVCPNFISGETQDILLRNIMSTCPSLKRTNLQKRLKASRVKQQRIRVREHSSVMVLVMSVYFSALWKTYASKRKRSRSNATVEREGNDRCDENVLNVLVRRTPPWLSDKLMKTLDRRKDARSEVAPKKERWTGRPSERNTPKDLPKWALQVPNQTTSSLSDSSSVSQESPVSSPVQSQVVSLFPNQSSPPTLMRTPSTANQIQTFTPRVSSRGSQPISPICSPLTHHVRTHHENMGSSSILSESKHLDSSDGESDDEISLELSSPSHVSLIGTSTHIDLPCMIVV